MPFDLVIKLKTLSSSAASLMLAVMVVGNVYLTAPAAAKIDIGALGAQSTMAEQGAICASFAALMENQILINQNLGNLWSERRKFSGAVIRRAVELSGLQTPTGDEIDVLINDYREWLLLNLSSQDTDGNITDYQTDVQNLIKTNCASLFVQADKAILKRFPDLAYLIDQDKAVQIDNSKEIESLLAKNQELNQKIEILNAEIATLKTEQISASLALSAAREKEESKSVPQAPDRRPTPPASQNEQTSQQTVISDNRFFAQLGSYSSKDIAASALADLISNFQGLFKDTDLEIKAHEFESGKTFFRVRTANASRATITTICDTLWQSRMGCLIKTIVD